MAFSGRLSDAQWARIAPQLPRRKRGPRGGRPPADDRKCLEGTLWILRTGAPWKVLPGHYGSPTTRWRRRCGSGARTARCRRCCGALLAESNDAEKVRRDECFGDGSFAPAKQGAPESARPGRAGVRSGCSWSMARVLRWEHTRTRPVRASRSSTSRRSPRSGQGGRLGRGGRGRSRTGWCWIAGTTATSCGPRWLVAESTRSCRRRGTIRTPRTRAGADFGAIAGAGSSSGRSRGLGGAGGCWCVTSGSQASTPRSSSRPVRC